MAAQIACYGNNTIIHNALLCTIGHELGHKHHEFHRYKLGKGRFKFAKYVNEVHADFYASYMFDENCMIREILIQSMDFKKKHKEQHQEDKNLSSHPSWQKRKEYVQNYDFDDTLIHKIATDCNCTDKAYIKSVCEHYRQYPIKSFD